MDEHDDEIETGESEQEVYDGDIIAPQVSPVPYQKPGKKAPYRALTIPERDTLFAYYEKHHGNMLAMSRDRDCQFKADSQIRYYAKLYNFVERFAVIQRKKAEETIAGLNDAKLEAVRQAVEMVRPRQVALRDSKRELILVDGQPIFETMYPDQKTIKTAWEIIKTELGEPTWIAKSEVHTPLHDEVRQALDLISKFTEHGGTRISESVVQGERGAAGNTPEVSPAVQHDPHPEQAA